jgi:hypothetical protein
MINVRNVAILGIASLVLSIVPGVLSAGVKATGVDVGAPICYNNVPSTADASNLDKFKTELDSWAGVWWEKNNQTPENNKPPQAKIKISCNYATSSCTFDGNGSVDDRDNVSALKWSWTLKKDEVQVKDSDKNKFTYTFSNDESVPGFYSVELKVMDSLNEEGTATDGFYYGIGQTEQGLWVSDIEERSGNFTERLYIPNYKNREIVVFSSKGAYQIVYPGCAELGQVLLNHPCRHQSSVEGGLIYSQRLELIDGKPRDGAYNPIRFNMDDGSDAWEFSKSMSWLPGDMNSYAPTADQSSASASFQYYAQQYYADENLAKGMNRLDQCVTEDWEMYVKYAGSLPAISSCDLISKIDEVEKSLGKDPLKGKRVIYVNFTSADKKVTNSYYNQPVSTRNDALSGTDNFCNDTRSLSQQKSDNLVECKLNLAQYCGKNKTVKLRYIANGQQKTVKVKSPVDCYFLLSAW